MTLNPFKLKPHPFSLLLPSASGSDYDHLLASVKKLKKLRYSIIIYQNMILDGNQRLRACREARVEPKYSVFEGTDEAALDLVWDLNIGRRQLTPSMKATAVAKFTLAYEQGERSDLSAGGQVTTDKLAEKAGVSRSTVYDAKKVLQEGTDEEKEALETGKAKAKPLAAKIRDRKSAQARNGFSQDDMGNDIPVAASVFWDRKPEAKNVLNQISACRGQVKKLSPDDPMWSAVNLNGVIADLSSAFNRFSAAIPAYVCPYCKGVKPDKCKCCKGKGVVSKFTWSTIPEEVRKKRDHPF